MATSLAEAVAWWGAGAPPTERWPGVTIPVDEKGGKYRFDTALADRVCDFFPRYCSHSKGEFSGKKFELLDYQTALILRPLFGWLRQDGTRRFRKAYIEIPKKNGKTQLIAGLALYMLLGDSEPGAEVYVAAADRDQARILFRAAVAMVEASPALSKRVVVYRNQIVRRDDPTAFFQVLSAEAATKHGPNIHCLIIDELHAQPNRELFETLTRGVVARRQPLILLITTAGDDDESICYEEYDYAKRVLSGTIEDEQYLPVIFESTPEDDYMDPKVWAKVNPAYGVTVSTDALAGFAREAFNEPRKRNDFLRFHLNRWVNSATAWIPVEWWDECKEALPSVAELAKCQCVFGIDMAQKIDLMAGVGVFRLPLARGEESLSVESTIVQEETKKPIKVTRTLDYRIAIVPMFFLPEETLRERVQQDGIRYDLYESDGLLRTVEGAIMGAAPMVSYVRDEFITQYPLAKKGEVAFDPAFATDVALALRDDVGLNVVEVRQNYNLSEACHAFEALIKAKRVIHGGNKVLRWCVENVAVKPDNAGRIQMVKPKKRTKRIDGVVATVIALSRLMLMPETKKSLPVFFLGGMRGGRQHASA